MKADIKLYTNSFSVVNSLSIFFRLVKVIYAHACGVWPTSTLFCFDAWNSQDAQLCCMVKYTYSGWYWKWAWITEGQCVVLWWRIFMSCPCGNSLPVRGCTTPLPPSYSCLSGQELSWSLGTQSLAPSLSRFDSSGFPVLGVRKRRLLWKGAKCEQVAWQNRQSCRMRFQWHACQHVQRNWISSWRVSCH
jgi:hypothetical protein